MTPAKVECDYGHPLSGDNLTVERSRGRAPYRRCRACKNERQRVGRAA